MNMDGFLDELAELLEIDRAELTNDYKLEENENWDSLAFISMIVMVDDHFQLSISSEALRKCKLVGDILRLITSKLEVVEQ